MLQCFFYLFKYSLCSKLSRFLDCNNLIVFIIINDYITKRERINIFFCMILADYFNIFLARSNKHYAFLSMSINFIPIFLFRSIFPRLFQRHYCLMEIFIFLGN